jgi:excisionase family DNA binding protein
VKPLTLQISVTVDEELLTDLIRRAVISAMGIDLQRDARVRASQHANFCGQKPPEDKGLLIDLRAAAKLLGLSQRTVWGMAKNGRMPKAIKIGRAARWSQDELRAWVNAGGPPLSEWKWPR